MGGEGSMKAMNDSIKANRALRRKKSFFSKNRTFLNRRKEYHKAAEGISNLKSATKEELELIRKEIIKKRRKASLVLLIILMILVLPISYYSYNTSNSTSKYNVNQEELQELKDNYFYYLNDGDVQLEKGNWHNAIFQYNKAIETFPNKFQAHYRLTYAYVYRCRNEQKDCEHAKEKIRSLLDDFPDNKDLLELKQVLNSIY